MTKDDQLDMVRAYESLRYAKAVIDQLAAKEKHHGYGSQGAALDKMAAKVKELATEARWMANDPGRGAQMVRGR